MCSTVSPSATQEISRSVTTISAPAGAVVTCFHCIDNVAWSPVPSDGRMSKVDISEALGEHFVSGLDPPFSVPPSGVAWLLVQCEPTLYPGGPREHLSAVDA